MAAMATSVTQFSDLGNSRTWAVSGHLATKAKLLVQRRKIPVGAEGVAEDLVSVIYGTVDSGSNPLSQKVLFEVKFRRPINGASADVTAALAVLRDIVASDEYTTLTTTQNFLK